MGEPKLEIDASDEESTEQIEIVRPEDRTGTGIKSPASGGGDLKRFGDYLLLDHLIDGGMASICRARYLGREVEKIVAIKMVKAAYSTDQEFKQMFIGEIKVSFGLIHPNIAQTYDYGMIDKQLFVAMEYIDGKNLKQFLDRTKETKEPFDVPSAVYIASKICEGLHYAHNFEDKLSGKKTCIVHRDISPHNIMLTYDGAVKVIDFGIAQTEKEENDGKVKGKISYFAPEYLEGKEIDHTYDQFAVGLTLWELLCGIKLFDAGNEIATLKAILECNVKAPSKLNRDVPKELDEIILKSLSRNPKERFGSMDEFNRGLIKFLFKEYPDFNPSDLATFAQESFAEEIESDREKLINFGKIDVSAYIDDAESERQQREAKESGEEIGEVTTNTRVEFDFGFQNVTYKNNSNLTQELELDFDGKKKATNKGRAQKMQAELLKTLKESGINPERYLVEQAEIRSASKKKPGQSKKKGSLFSTKFFLVAIFLLGGLFVYTSLDVLNLVNDFPIINDFIKKYDELVPKDLQKKLVFVSDDVETQKRPTAKKDLEAAKDSRSDPKGQSPEAPASTQEKKTDAVESAKFLSDVALKGLLGKENAEKYIPQKAIDELMKSENYVGFFNRAKHNFKRLYYFIWTFATAKPTPTNQKVRPKKTGPAKGTNEKK